VCYDVTVRFVLIALCVVACTSEPSGHAPIARITATPRAIPDHDGFQTDVVLDGTASADPIDDPDGGLPLAFLWTITNDDVQYTMGRDTEPKVTVRFLGNHPAIVDLKVTDVTGLSSTAELNMQLTILLPDAGP
jgi:hypothetical protein